MKNIFILLVISLLPKIILAQTTKQVAQEEQLWLGYFNQTRLSDRWGLWADVHFRATDGFVREPSKFLFRAGLMYYLTDDFKLTNGYNYINHFPEEGHANVSMPEHRIWHQLHCTPNTAKYVPCNGCAWKNVGVIISRMTTSWQMGIGLICAFVITTCSIFR